MGQVLLPVLLHEVNNTTQLLVGLRALLELPGGEALFAQRAGDLARASDAMYDLGFALAVVATAGGANMLLARRHPRALEILWELTARALSRSGAAPLERSGTPLDLRPDALDGWQAPWSVAALLIEADTANDGSDWSWRWLDDGSLVGTSARARELSGLGLERITARAPGTSIELLGNEVTWRAPKSWLVERAADGPPDQRTS